MRGVGGEGEKEVGVVEEGGVEEEEEGLGGWRFWRLSLGGEGREMGWWVTMDIFFVLLWVIKEGLWETQVGVVVGGEEEGGGGLRRAVRKVEKKVEKGRGGLEWEGEGVSFCCLFVWFCFPLFLSLTPSWS